MRTQSQIDLIKSTFSEPRSFHKVISEEKINSLIQHYNTSDNKIVKNTGPTVLNIKEGTGVIDDIVQYLRTVVGDFDVRFAHYFETSVPHILHNDDDFTFPRLYKAFVIPLHYNPSGTVPKLVVFNQSYFDGPSKFIAGEDSTNFQVYYNKMVTDYTNVHDKDYSKLATKDRELISHIKDSWLEGLSIQGMLDWNIRDILMFDSAKIHCASDFRLNNINKKLAISIFTTLR